MAPEKVGRHTETQSHNQRAHDARVESSRVARPTIAADSCCHHHYQAVTPDDLSSEDESHDGDAIRHGGGHDLERIDVPDILDAKNREHRHDKEAGSSAEVADVDANKRDSQRERNKGGEIAVAMFYRASRNSPGDSAAAGK